MSQYFLKPYEPFGGDINVKVELVVVVYFKFCIKKEFR